MSPRFAIGVGCKRECSAADLLAVIREACSGIDLRDAGLFTLYRKRAEPGLHDVAAILGLPLTFLLPERLAACTDRLTHRSSRVEAATGVPSVAEAAALAGAGPRGRLIVPRHAHAAATCAVAAQPEHAA